MRQIKFHCISTWESSNGFYTHIFYISHAHWAHGSAWKCWSIVLFTIHKRTRTHTMLAIHNSNAFGRTFFIANSTHSILVTLHIKSSRTMNFLLPLVLLCEICMRVWNCWSFARGFWWFPYIFGQCMASNWHTHTHTSALAQAFKDDREWELKKNDSIASTVDFVLFSTGPF